MKAKFMIVLVLAALLLSGCGLIQDTPARVMGSGNVITEPRAISGFTAISLEGSADVQVVFGETESVTITGEDNIVPLIETVVQNNQLIIKTRPLMNYTATKPVVVSVTMKSLKRASLSGSGTVSVADLVADSFKAELPGSGTFSLGGTANTVDLNLSGSGTISGDALKSKAAKVVVSGSGNVMVNASESLEATITGSGNIRYSGSPAQITKTITGSGTIQE